MADNKANDPPIGQESTTDDGKTETSASQAALDSEKIVGNPTTLEAVSSNVTADEKEAQRAGMVESLGIPDWQAKEKKVVRVLDMTLLPQLWILYMFNFLVNYTSQQTFCNC